MTLSPSEKLKHTIDFLERRLSGKEYCELIGVQGRTAGYGLAGSAVRKAIREGHLKLIRVTVEPLAESLK